jgi:hypothetical protein
MIVNPIKIKNVWVYSPSLQQSFKLAWVEYEPETPDTHDEPGQGAYVDFGKITTDGGLELVIPSILTGRSMQEKVLLQEIGQAIYAMFEE